MIDVTAIEDALYVWANGVLGIQVIFAHPGVDRPIIPYAVINVLQSKQIGYAETEQTLEVNNTVTIDYSGLVNLFVTVNIYYESAFSNANKLRDSLDRITVHEDLYADGLGFLRADTVRDIPEVIDKKWEQRAQFDCFFSYRSTDSENLTTINQIELTNELDDTEIIVTP